ncbi:hypothetical protein AB0C76_23145 [Kitasatospora sp. NPDC048722]|jgi:hypothetical protein
MSAVDFENLPEFDVEELEMLDAPGFLGWDKETWAGFAVGAGISAGILAT